MNRYVLLVDRATEAEEQEVSNFLDANGVAWWHFFRDSWLVADRDAHFKNKKALAEGIKELLSHRGSILVFSAKTSNGFGWVPEDSTEWLSRWWSSD